MTRHSLGYRAVLVAMGLALSSMVVACAGGSTPAPSATSPTDVAPTAPPSPTPSLPTITLDAGDRYFSIDGKETLLFARNLAGWEAWQYDHEMDRLEAGGTRLVRIQLDSMGLGYDPAGAIDPAWAANWEYVLDAAAEREILVIPVFSAWFDWNAGEGYSQWPTNPFNAANGGPASTPADLFDPRSQTRALWMEWMGAVVERWEGRPAIVAWEIFSELNLATGTSEAGSVAFIEEAATIIRDGDAAGRPITASLAEFGHWPSFFASDAIDFINIHPYWGQLDRSILDLVHEYLGTYGKPVLIGESGLDATVPEGAGETLTTAVNAKTGIRHAVWATLVSGAMNGRTLYWEDSFGIYFPTLDWEFIDEYAGVERPAATFATDVDFSGYVPMSATTSTRVFGGVLGNEATAIGWMRVAACEPPDWPIGPALVDEQVVVKVPGTSGSWRVQFYDTKTGDAVGSAATVPQVDGTVTIMLPAFDDDIAFKMVAE